MFLEIRNIRLSMKILLRPLQRGFIFSQILIRRHRIVGGSEGRSHLIPTNDRGIDYTIAKEIWINQMI
jgi:hypothetical protein